MRLLLTQKEINTLKVAVAAEQQIAIHFVSDQDVFDYLEDKQTASELAAVRQDKNGKIEYREPWNIQDLAYDIIGHIHPRFLTEAVNNYQFVR